MKTYAYCRVSTVEQDTQMQVDAIVKRYPDAVVMTEKASASNREGRPQLDLLLKVVGEGDRLVVWKLDRLARNMADLSSIVNELETKGASLEILDQRIDTSTASGKAFLQMLGVFAEFETNLRKERQAAGIAKAKAQGKYKGRKQACTPEQVKALLDEGMTKTEAAAHLGVTYRTVLRKTKGYTET